MEYMEDRQNLYTKIKAGELFLEKKFKLRYPKIFHNDIEKLSDFSDIFGKSRYLHPNSGKVFFFSWGTTGQCQISHHPGRIFDTDQKLRVQDPG